MPALGRPLHSRLRRFSRAAGFSLEGASMKLTLLGAFWPPVLPGVWPVAATAMGVIAVKAKRAIRPRSDRSTRVTVPGTWFPPDVVVSCHDDTEQNEKNPACLAAARGQHPKETLGYNAVATVCEPCRAPRWNRLAVVGGFAVGRDVQTFAFGFFRDAQTHDQVNNLVGDEGHDAGPHDGDDDTFGLDQQLAGDGVVVALDAAERAGREHAGQQGTDDAADAVHTEHVQRVARAEHLLEARDAPQAQEDGHQTDDDGTHGAHRSASRGDGDQTSNPTRRSPQHG